MRYLIFIPQGFIVDILVNQGVVPCIAEYVSRSGMGMVVKVGTKYV